jgi:hypothetical protein
MRYEEDIKSPHKKLFFYARDLILSLDNEMVEKKRKCITSYFLYGSCLCTLKTTKSGLYLTIGQGAKIVDRNKNKYEILKGDGKIVRHMRYESIKSIDELEFTSILKEGIIIIFEKS